MLKPIFGFAVLALAFSICAQNNRKGSHTSGQRTHTTSHTSTQRTHSSNQGSHGTRTGTDTRTHGGHHHSGSHHRMRQGSGNFGGPVATDRRPHGIGHARDWFDSQRWSEGPAYQIPTYSCYPGFVWNARPSLDIVVWIFDETSGQYYQAFYYPQYGYYAWVDNPLVAVGEYSPQIAIIVQ